MAALISHSAPEIGPGRIFHQSDPLVFEANGFNAGSAFVQLRTVPLSLYGAILAMPVGMAPVDFSGMNPVLEKDVYLKHGKSHDIFRFKSADAGIYMAGMSQAGSATAYTVFAVSGIDLTARRIGPDIAVLVYRVNNAKPVRGSVVQIHDEKGLMLSSAVTGIDGTVLFHGMDTMNRLRIIAFSGRQTAVCDTLSKPVNEFDSVVVFTDRDFYFPGDPVNVLVLAARADVKKHQGQAINITMVGADGCVVDEVQTVLDSFGSAAYTFNDFPAKRQSAAIHVRLADRTIICPVRFVDAGTCRISFTRQWKKAPGFYANVPQGPVQLEMSHYVSKGTKPLMKRKFSISPQECLRIPMPDSTGFLAFEAILNNMRTFMLYPLEGPVLMPEEDLSDMRLQANGNGVFIGPNRSFDKSACVLVCRHDGRRIDFAGGIFIDPDSNARSCLAVPQGPAGYFQLTWTMYSQQSLTEGRFVTGTKEKLEVHCKPSMRVMKPGSVLFVQIETDTSTGSPADCRLAIRLADPGFRGPLDRVWTVMQSAASNMWSSQDFFFVSLKELKRSEMEWRLALPGFIVSEPICPLRVTAQKKYFWAPDIPCAGRAQLTLRMPTVPGTVFLDVLAYDRTGKWGATRIELTVSDRNDS